MAAAAAAAAEVSLLTLYMAQLLANMCFQGSLEYIYAIYIYAFKTLTLIIERSKFSWLFFSPQESHLSHFIWQLLDITLLLLQAFGPICQHSKSDWVHCRERNYCCLGERQA